MQTILLWLVPFFPALAALALGLLPLKNDSRRTHLAAACALAVNFGLCLWLMFLGDGEATLFWLGENLPIPLRSDVTARLFLLLCGGMWLNSGVFSFGYLPHEGHEQRYFIFYLLTIAAINAICLSATLVTMYLFFELMTLLSMALVVHNMSKEAVAAGIKYLLYSIAGAMMGLFGIFVFSTQMTSPTFVAGGAIAESSPLILWATLITVIGFATKAGMFPMHGWLPTAHPIAPAPASAVLSGVITKMGVLCVVRVLFFTVGAANLRGTFVQTVLLILALCTVFMGSMMAFKTTGFKKRLAYSTVSQVSYILFGLFLMTPQAFAGAVEHMYFHSIMKNALFLCAGAVILKTGSGWLLLPLFAILALPGCLMIFTRLGKDGGIELGYVIHPRFHGKGYMTQALKAAIEELFSDGYREVITGAFEENRASIRVMEKAGMILQGKTEEIEYRGKTHNCIYYHMEKSLC